jgi:hypothetical protein
MESTVEFAPAGTRVYVPHGIGEIVSEFGEINKYVGQNGELEPQWQAEFLGQAEIPFPLELSWDHSKAISRFTCHKKMVNIFENVFGTIQVHGLQSTVWSFGGCFSFRPQRTGHKLSTHCWGIAIDLNPETNGLGTAGNMDPRVVATFRECGFTWGGDWLGRGRDPMHFQFCSGY